MNNKKEIVQKVVLAGVVFSQEGEVLILQRNAVEKVFPNMWELPSGKRESLENSIECLKREIDEEAGLEVNILYAMSTFDYQIEKEDIIKDTVQINYVCEKSGGEVKISEEHQDYKWISHEDIDDYELSDETKAAIKQSFQFYEKIT